MQLEEAITYIKSKYPNDRQIKQTIKLFYTSDSHKKLIKLLQEEDLYLPVILDLVSQDIPLKIKKSFVKYLEGIVPDAKYFKKYIFTFLELHELNHKILSKFCLDDLICLTREEFYLIPNLIYAIIKSYDFHALKEKFNQINPITLLRAFILVFKDIEIVKDPYISVVINLLKNGKFLNKRYLYSLVFRSTYKSYELDVLFNELFNPCNLDILSFYASKSNELIYFLNAENSPKIFFKVFLRVYENLDKSERQKLLLKKLELIFKNENAYYFFKKIKTIVNFSDIKNYLINAETKVNAIKAIQYIDIIFYPNELNLYYKIIYNYLQNNPFVNCRRFIKNNTKREDIVLFINTFIKERNYKQLSYVYGLLTDREKYELNALALEYIHKNEQVIYYLEKALNESLNQDFIIKKIIPLVKTNLNYNLIKLIDKLRVQNIKEYFLISKEIILKLETISTKKSLKCSSFLSKVFFYDKRIIHLLLNNFNSADKRTRKNSITVISTFGLKNTLPSLMIKYTLPDFKMKIGILKVLTLSCQNDAFIFRRNILDFVIDALSQKDLTYNLQGFKLLKELIKYLQRNELICALEISFMFIFKNNSIILDCIKLIINKLGVELMFNYAIQGLFHASKNVRNKYKEIIKFMKEIDEERVNEMFDELNCDGTFPSFP